MVPGVDPKIDYAFKRLFGLERNRELLIGLIHAVLKPRPAERIAKLRILNPFSDKETLDDKLSIVDIKATDQTGRQFHVEMQMLAEFFFPKRVLYYWAKLHQQQMHEGDEYQILQSTISICFMNSVLFPQVPDYHLPFRLLNPQHQIAFTDDLALHMIEMPKFNLTLDQLTDPLSIWVYFLRHAETLDADALPEPLNQPAIRKAMGELKMLTQNDLERERYEARVKMHRDVISLVKAAEMRGLEEGQKRGSEQGRQQGLQEGRQEGQVKGELIGRIHLCQRRLHHAMTPAEELLALPDEELIRLADQLENQLFP